MTRPTFSVKATIGLVLLNSLVWLAFAGVVAARLHPALPADGLVRWGMVALALSAGCVLLLLAILLRRRNRLAYSLAVAALLFLAVLTIADEVGLADLVVLVVVLAPLLLLIKDRRWYLGRDSDER